MRTLIALLMSGALALTPAADPTTAPTPEAGDTSVSGRQEGKNVTVNVGSQIRFRGDGVEGGTGDGYRLKSPCWYEPFLNAEDMIKFRTDPRTHRNEIANHEERFNEANQPFLDKKGQEGLWWSSAYDTADPKGASCWAGLPLFVFVPPNDTPPLGITPAMLAEIARGRLTVPEHKITLSPDAKSFVNLPTWVAVDGIQQPRRTLTAEIPGRLSVTVVATLKEIRIDSGTTGERAEVREDGCGTSGRRFAKGAEFTCGVRYLRASIDQPREAYTMSVTTVWPVEVAGDAAGLTFTPIQVEATRDVQVGEIQSNVRP
ncbi:hypothetical protein HII36_26575 [Nonomuraea sp. NN258]|uniref:hypothetical protein n=1 Tax=Nonomuraea antri TaxID=2730852 RepID=UPI0015693D7B|nr:hypothetical protein [Nonomuraea antri]NRQ35366.1 hypothetical protein [Nonomuraea antri]